jgi:hypothetical protein
MATNKYVKNHLDAWNLPTNAKKAVQSLKSLKVDKQVLSMARSDIPHQPPSQLKRGQ